MSVKISKLISGTTATILTGKGIKNPESTSTSLMRLNSVIFTGTSGSGSVTIVLSANDFQTGTTRTITLFSDFQIYEGTIISVLPESMSFTDAYTIKATSTASTTLLLDYAISDNNSFVAEFEKNNE